MLQNFNPNRESGAAADYNSTTGEHAVDEIEKRAHSESTFEQNHESFEGTHAETSSVNPDQTTGEQTELNPEAIVVNGGAANTSENAAVTAPAENGLDLDNLSNIEVNNSNAYDLNSLLEQIQSGNDHE